MIGVDLIRISRVKDAAARSPSFLDVFTKNEKDYIDKKHNKAESMAGIFAAKEAVVKALGEGFGAICPRDVEICHNQKGAPFALVRGQKIEVSISHDGDYAIATALCPPVF